MSPPSSGGVALVQMLNILEGYELHRAPHNGAHHLHHLIEAMRLAYRDRARFLADPDFVDVPVARLTSKDYAARLRAGIDARLAGVSSPADVMLLGEGDQTTHFSVVDADGMAVAVTYTLEFGYGSRITVPGAGFLLNNEMGDFNPRAGSTSDDGTIGTAPNVIRPGQRMLSSMTPTILVRGDVVEAVIGSPGGRSIINTVLQVAYNYMEFGMPLQDAVEARRLNHQWLPDRARIEPGGAGRGVLEELRRRGHDIREGGRQGSVHAVGIEPFTGARAGYVDSRDRDGAAVGY
jgi:gamma-glutamyltranspeptidase / glutathione hydrolase